MIISRVGIIIITIAVLFYLHYVVNHCAHKRGKNVIVEAHYLTFSWKGYFKCQLLR